MAEKIGSLKKGSSGGTHEIRIVNYRYYSGGYWLQTTIYVDGEVLTQQTFRDADGTQLDYTFTV